MLENWFDPVITAQVTPSELRGLKGPIKAGELGLNGESSSARPSGKTSFDPLA